MKNSIAYILILGFLLVLSCVEEIDLKTEVTFESALVIEATITNEVKNQVIYLSRAYPLDEQEPLLESNAEVNVIDTNGTAYQFLETESGKYVSIVQFSAEPNTEYQLDITTIDGRSYGSSKEVLTSITQIDDLYVERNLNENGEEGVSVYVDSFDPTGNSNFYRYTYQESYKIVAPKYSPLDLTYEYVYDGNVPISANYFLITKPQQQQICYNTMLSNTIILESTTRFEEDRIDRFRVRFMSRDNYIISHRYSILVSQYVQTPEAHAFYQKLRDLTDSGNILSQSQPGFLSGNVFSETNSEEIVVGFFQVSSVNSRRVYFNYEDLFPGEQLPPYFISCPVFAPLPQVGLPPPSFPLAGAIDLGNKYFEPNDEPEDGEGPYFLVAPACGDCTVLGNNFPPDFWVE